MKRTTEAKHRASMTALIVLLLASTCTADWTTAELGVGDSVRVMVEGNPRAIVGVIQARDQSALSVAETESKSMVWLRDIISLETQENGSWVARGAEIARAAIQDSLSNSVTTGDSVRVRVRGRQTSGRVVDQGDWGILVESGDNSFQFESKQIEALELYRGGEWTPTDPTGRFPVRYSRTLSSNLTLIHEDLSFWERAWLENAPNRSRIAYAQLRSTYEWHTDQRQYLLQTADQAIAAYEEAGRFVNDPFLDDYLNSCLLTVYPKPLLGGRTTEIRVRAVLSPRVNASAFPNGQILVYAGLLAELKSRAELEAVLAHEVGHIVFDHSYESVRKAQRRQVFKSVLTGVAAGTAAYAAAKAGWDPEDVYLGAVAAGALTNFIADDVIESLGMKFSREQEMQSDVVAQRWLVHSDKDTNAMARALERLRVHEWLRGVPAQNESESTHPLLDHRIQALRPPPGYQETPIDEDHSMVVSDLRIEIAKTLLAAENYTEALRHLDADAESGWATTESGLLRAMILRKTSDSEDSNREALQLAMAAIEDGIPVPWAYGEAALLHMRLHDYTNASEMFKLLAEADTNSKTSIWAQRMHEKVAARARRQ